MYWTTTFVCILMVSLSMLWLNRTWTLDMFLLCLLVCKTGDASFLNRLASSLEPDDFTSPLFSGFFDICVLNWERLLFSSLSGTLFIKLGLWSSCADVDCFSNNLASWFKSGPDRLTWFVVDESATPVLLELSVVELPALLNWTFELLEINV